MALTSKLTLALTCLLSASSVARAAEPAAVELAGLAAKDSELVRAELEKKLAALGIELVDSAATRASIQAFLKGSPVSAPDASMQALRKQMGVSHFALVRQLPRDKGAKSAVFQVKVFGPDESTEVRVASVPDSGLVEGVAALVSELLPHQLVLPADDKDGDANPETSRRHRHRRWRAALIPSEYEGAPVASGVRSI